jgi:hypothetical protein
MYTRAHRCTCTYSDHFANPTCPRLYSHVHTWGSPNMYGNTALHQACRRGHAGMVDMLMNSGARIDVCNNKGSSPLHFLCYCEDKQTNTLKTLDEFISRGTNMQILTYIYVCVFVDVTMTINTYIQTYIHTHIHTYIHTYTYA